ncbi:hypothetical protein [Nocardioides sp. YIM 152588]|uniref:hypothetical protein n=1 Tax=Nocardioides sp. YIM 152588 TaxID=3158259 RepID=UPI0032E4FADD
MAARAGIQEPVPHALGRVLRRAVLEHGRGEGRRTYPPTLNAGFPGGARRTLEVPPSAGLDHCLRIEVVQAMVRDHLAGGRVPLLWLTRPRLPDDAEGVDDQAWASAVRAAGAELGVDLVLVVVTKQSWRDPRTGVGRGWQRPIRRG